MTLTATTTATSQIGLRPMPEDLSTRIAAAIMDSCHGVYLDDAVNAADAVIAELGMRPERVELLRRYVTEWESE